MRERGFSLAEVLVALLILAIVITTTIAMFAERQQRLREANETILAYQALANEAEYWRRTPFAQIADTTSFKSDTAVIMPLQPFSTAVKVDSPRADVKNVALTITWNGGKRKATLALARVDTGGTNLW